MNTTTLLQKTEGNVEIKRKQYRDYSCKNNFLMTKHMENYKMQFLA